MSTKSVELGSGYGAGARYLATNFGATVDCIDLSLEANDRNRDLTAEAGLSHLVNVLPATFFRTGLPTGAYGFCFSQDALCHAGKQTPRALEEAARLLSPGGILACTNILRTENATELELEGVLVRLQLNYLETLESFVGHAGAAGFELVESLDKTTSMATHFQTLLEVLCSSMHASGTCARVPFIIGHAQLFGWYSLYFVLWCVLFMFRRTAYKKKAVKPEARSTCWYIVIMT